MRLQNFIDFILAVLSCKSAKISQGQFHTTGGNRIFRGKLADIGFCQGDLMVLSGIAPDAYTMLAGERLELDGIIESSAVGFIQ